MTRSPVPLSLMALAAAREASRLKWPTTQEFAAMHDHARLPWRFFGRFTSSIAAGLTR